MADVTIQRKKRAEKQRKAERKSHKEAKERLKTRGDHLREAQTQFNRFIRARDYDLPCISCGTQNPNIQYCAGHYFTVGGHPELRFDELNVHKQCNKSCNMELSGNIAAYRVSLVKKIGREGMDYLEGPHDPKNYIIADVQEIKQKYAKLARELEGQHK